MAFKQQKNYGSYAWLINQNCFQQMMQSQNGTYFTSPEFTMASLQWRVCAFPNGKSEVRQGKFDLCLSLKSKIPHDQKLFIRKMVRCPELDITDVCVLPYTNNKKFKTYSLLTDLLLDEIQRVGLMKLTFLFQVRILRIFKGSELIYQNSMICKQPFIQQSFVWDIQRNLMKKIKNCDIGRIFGSDVFNKMWYLCIVPKKIIDENEQSTSLLALNLCGIPKNISQIRYKCKIILPQMNKSWSRTKTVDLSNIRMTFKIPSFFESYAQHNTMRIITEIEIIELYDNNKQIIEPADWGQYIGTMVADRKELDIKEVKQEYEAKLQSQQKCIEKMQKEIKALKQNQSRKHELAFKMKRKFINNALVLIIAISSYDGPVDDLYGAKVDKKKMTELFMKYEYDVISNQHDRVNMKQFKALLVEAKGKIEEYGVYDGFILLISAHGELENNKIQHVVTSEGKTMNLEEIRRCFNGKALKKFINCPKFFISDICRGDTDAVGIVNNHSNSNHNGHGDDDEGETDEEDIDMFSAVSKGGNKHHPDKNMITIFCNTTGYQTYDTKQGGYLINAVNDVLSSDMTARCDVIRLSERIKRRVSQISKQMNCAETNITEMDFDFYLPPHTY